MQYVKAVRTVKEKASKPRMASKMCSRTSFKLKNPTNAIYLSQNMTSTSELRGRFEPIAASLRGGTNHAEVHCSIQEDNYKPTNSTDPNKKSGK